MSTADGDDAGRIRHLEEHGYTVFPDFLDRHTAGRIRAHMDGLLPPVLPAGERPDEGRVRTLRHPIPGAIMAELASRPKLIELAMKLLRMRDVQNLRLLEQVLIRTDPKPPPYGAGGWHVDMAFFPSDYESTPRGTYYHMVHALNTVPPGGGAFMIVPGSHKQTYAASARMGGKEEEIAKLKVDPIGVAGIDTSKAIEVRPDEGDLLVFNPMALHSASGNASTEPRYVYFASFMDAGATRLLAEMRRTKYRANFPPSLRDGLPEELKGMLAP